MAIAAEASARTQADNAINQTISNLTYANTITYSDGNGGTLTLNAKNNNFDFTQIIIDGGTY